MAALGEMLREAREKKGLTFDAIARDTNIARRYLAALEEEDFSQFPAEAYMLGFLKNYAEYLGLVPKELLAMYRSIKIQEQPAPIVELLTKRKGKAAFVAPIVIAVVLGLGSGAYFLFFRPAPIEKPEPLVHEATGYDLNDGILEQRFYSGDFVTIETGGEKYRFSIANLGEAVTINSPSGPLILVLSNTAAVDVNNDGVNELEISLEDYSKSDPLMGAWIRFNLHNNREAAAAEDVLAEIIAPAESKTVFTSTNPYPFTLQIQFLGFCMFRWEILREAGRQGRNEQYFSRGGGINIQAQNGIRLWASNAASVQIEAIGGGRTQSVELGNPGEVVVADVAWVREGSGWKLALIRLEN